MTERLYYTDSFLTEFDGRVLEARQVGERTALVLDRTAFYPTSGGQVFDTGRISADGQEVGVEQVEEDEAGNVLHFVGRAVPAGTQIHGSVDMQRRRDHMQQHSGQHVLSAAFVRLFNMPTVSFHMGDESCTIDLQTRSISSKQQEEAERLANDIIAEDRPVEVRFHSATEAQGMGVRKIPQTDRDKLRLIDIHEFDLTACGGTHVRSTGQIGAILLRKSENVKQGVRVEFVCGSRAIRTARRDYTTLLEAAALFSTHIWELPQQIRKAQDEARASSRAQQRLLEELAESHAQKMLAAAPAGDGQKVIVAAIKDRDVSFVRLLAQKIAAAGQPAVALLGTVVGQPTLVFAQSHGLQTDLGAVLKQTMAAFGGRGGGSKDFAQGGVADAAKIEPALQSALQVLRG